MFIYIIHLYNIIKALKNLIIHYQRLGMVEYHWKYKQ
jgi:hypothetical protein